MRMLRLLTIFCLLFAAVLPALAQETTATPRVYASDMTQRGTRVAIALEAAVEVYDMRYPERTPQHYAIGGVTALAFSSDGDYLALGNALGITILNAHSLAVVNHIDQPASALVWMMYDNRLVAGWEQYVTVFDSSDQPQSEPYPVLETLLAYETQDPNVEYGYYIRGLQVLRGNGSARDWNVFIVYGYDINYGNHGESFQGVSQYSFAEETLTDVTGGMETIIRQRELAQFTYDERYALFGNVWLDREVGQLITLPVAAPA